MKRYLLPIGLIVLAALFIAGSHASAVTLPTGTALFETSLASRITSSDTSMTLVSNSVRGSESVSGYACFTIDEGRSDSEYVCGTVSGTSVTSLERGLSLTTGTTTIAALQFAHRVGANVKITDYPLINRLRNQNNGIETFPNTVRYASGVTPAATGDLTDKEYVDGVAFSGAGVIDASTVAKGVSELASGCEVASSTSSGTSGPLVIAASSATSTYNLPTAPCRVVTTDNLGKIDNNFISTSTLIANNGVGYTLPSVRGASSTVLTENGSGILTWLKPNMTLLAATTSTAAMSFATTTFAAASHLKVVYYSAGCNTATIPQIHFNNDAATNYGYTISDNGGAMGLTSTTGALAMSAVSTTSPQFYTFDIINLPSARKFVTWEGTHSSSAAFAPQHITGSAVWNNTSSAITSISFSCGSNPAVTLGIGTTIAVYGSAF